jgi:endonuclease YncB( thermonuclease family)
MSRFKALVAAATLQFVSQAAFAQSDDITLTGNAATVAEMDIHVTELANDALSKYLDDSHKAVLKALTHQVAVAVNCEEFDLDEARYKEEMAYVFDFLGTLKEEERENATLVTMMGYSALLGGQHAIAAFDYDAFCLHAVEEQAHEGSENHVILTAVE